MFEVARHKQHDVDIFSFFLLVFPSNRELDWIENFWPEELRRKEFPKVQLYCLMSVKNSFTDLYVDILGISFRMSFLDLFTNKQLYFPFNAGSHIDFAGSSVGYCLHDFRKFQCNIWQDSVN